MTNEDMNPEDENMTPEQADKLLAEMYAKEAAALDKAEAILGTEVVDRLMKSMDEKHELSQGHMWKEMNDHPALRNVGLMGMQMTLLVEHVVNTAMLVGYILGRADEKEDAQLGNLLGDINLDLD